MASIPKGSVGTHKMIVTRPQVVYRPSSGIRGWRVLSEGILGEESALVMMNITAMVESSREYLRGNAILSKASVSGVMDIGNRATSRGSSTHRSIL